MAVYELTIRFEIPDDGNADARALTVGVEAAKMMKTFGSPAAIERVTRVLVTHMPAVSEVRPHDGAPRG